MPGSHWMADMLRASAPAVPAVTHSRTMRRGARQQHARK